MDTLTALINGRALIADKRNWFGGDEPHRNDPNQLCTHQALDRASNGDVGTYCRASTAFNAVTGKHGLVGWNDRNTHAVVMAGWDKAIAVERAKFEALFLNPPLVQRDCTEPNSTRIEEGMVP